MTNVTVTKMLGQIEKKQMESRITHKGLCWQKRQRPGHRRPAVSLNPVSMEN